MQTLETKTRARLAVAALLGALVANACGSGFDTEDAQAECARIGQGQCATGLSYDECVACFEDCGRECDVVQGPACHFTCD